MESTEPREADRMVQLVSDVLDPRQAVASRENWQRSYWYWEKLIQSRVLPQHVKTPEIAIAITEAGRVRGWSAMQSLEMLCLIEGTIAMRAKAMWGEILKFCRTNKEEGIRVRPVERSMQRSAIEVTRPDVFGSEPVLMEFTQEDAQQAGLWMRKSKSGKPSNWELWPKAMLFARTVSIVGRDGFDDVTLGLYTIEEMEDAIAVYGSAGTVTQMPRTAVTSLDDLAAMRASSPAPKEPEDEESEEDEPEDSEDSVEHDGEDDAAR